MKNSKSVQPANTTITPAIVEQNFEVAVEKGIMTDLLKSKILERLDTAEVEPISLATTNFDFTQGQPERFVFLGIVNQLGQNQDEMPAIVMIDSEMNTFTNMATILVDTFQNRQVPIGTPVEITWTKNKKTGKGHNVRLWKVCLVKA
ncbi:MAG: hypothetical protein AAF599_07165 [Bacteroidota bacterium]